jgi:hypothetical protein
MGVINDLTLMCSFMKPFRLSGNKLLQEVGVDEDKLVGVTEAFKSDLGKFARVIETARKGIPIPLKQGMPPLFSKTFYSDAAGGNFAMHRGKRVNLNVPGDRGVACLEVTGDQVTWWCDLSWPSYFLDEALDSKGAHYGSKTTTLEAIGVLLPFLTIPETLMGRNLVFTVDNIAVVYGWDNRTVKFDDAASVILRTVHIISAYLGCIVHITHSHRRSTKWEILSDNLSRTSTRSFEDRMLVREAKRSIVKGKFMEWLMDPQEDWDLPNILLGEVKEKLKI